jgi:hypothetical protein
MTDTTDSSDANARRFGPATEGPARGHFGELKLRQLVAGELKGDEHDAVAGHVAGCAGCGRRVEAVRAEQGAFERQISFDRFAAGVERASRIPAPAPTRWWKRPANTSSFVGVFGLGAVAATAALVITARPLFEQARSRNAANVAHGTNRTKGGDRERPSVTVRVAPSGDGAQRTAVVNGVETLGVGERLRIGVRAAGRRYLFAVSVDDQGVVTPLYPEVGISVALPPAADLQYLPDAIELTGRGRERLVVVLTDEPTELDIIKRAVAVAFDQAKGDLARLPDLALDGDQFHRMFLKP